MYSEVSAFNVEGPPVPIPNTEVKLNCAENTWLATARKNRSVLTQKPMVLYHRFFYFIYINSVKDKNGKVYCGLKQQHETSDRLDAESQQIVDEFKQRLAEKYGEDVFQYSPKDVGYEDKTFDFGVTQTEINSYVEKAYQKANDKSYIKFLERATT